MNKMSKYKFLSFVLCLILSSGFGTSEKNLKWETHQIRQIFYEDIMNKPKVFRSRAEEKDQIPTRAESEINQDIKPSLDPELLANLLADLDTNTNVPTKGSSIKVPNSFKGGVKPKPDYEDDYHFKPKPKPTYEESFAFKPIFDKPIRHKPKPAYEEPYILRPFTQVSSRASSSYKRPFTVQAPSNLAIKKPINHGNYGLDNHFPVGQNHNADTPRRQPRPYKEKHVNTIPGIPGKDYPVYHEVPYTSFVCDSVPFKPGMYANPETGCQAYHVCHDNRHGPQGASFLCTNGTIFNQETFNCDWWFNVDCNQAVSFYSLNSDPNFNPYFKKPAEVIQYKSENLPKLHKPKLASNLLLESQVSPTFSKSSWPEAPTFPNFMFFSSEKGHPEPANPIQKNVLAPVVSHPPGEVKARTKVERTASFSAPKTVQDSENRFSNDAGRPEIKSERTILPSGSKQSFEMEEKIEKSQEILRKFEDSSESINIKKKSTILPTPSPSGRRVLRRRKRPRPNGPISATVSESTRRKSAYKKEPKSEISDVDIPEGAILDFEWGQRTS